MADIINYQLAGFHDIDESAMEIINKNIVTHARKIALLAEKESILHITLKKVHEREKGEIYDLHVKLPDKGKVYASHVTDRNLLAAVDKALQKLVNEMD
jgi:ribosome-associated translation inhibitor RaiA